MEINQGATPAQAATPPIAAAVKTQPASSVAPVEEGKVTITTKEYAQLQRADARAKSFDKRVALNTSRNNPARETNGAGATPEQQALATEQARADAADQRALQAEVRNSVRDLLAKPEFASLPASTKDLVLKNPQMLSNADNLEDALIDIEDELWKLAEEGGENIPVVVKNSDGSTRPAATSNHETPPTSAGGAAVPEGGVMEDTSKLTGSARSRAIIRNNLRTAKTGAPK